MGTQFEQWGQRSAWKALARGGEMARLIREHGWALSPLGDVSLWPPDLRTAVSICLGSRVPIMIFWGAELRQVYNDAYLPILGPAKHPLALGQRGEDCWSETWDVLGPILHHVLTTGETCELENQLLLLGRNGSVEETYFTFFYSPIYGETNEVSGIFCTATETTHEVLNATRDFSSWHQAGLSVAERARQFEAIFEAISDPLFIINAHAGPYQMNRASRALLNFPAMLAGSQLPEGKRLFKLYDEQDRLLSYESWPQVRILHGETLQGENAVDVRMHTYDGRTLFLSVTGAPVLYGEDGEVSTAILVCRDVTERKLFEKALRVSEERYRTIVHTTREGIWLIDTNAHTLYVNEGMALMLGYTSVEMAERTILDCVFPEDEPNGRARIRRNLRGRFEQFEFRFRRKDGNELHALASTCPVRDEADSIVGALAMFTDITGRKHMEQALKKSEELLKMALKNTPIAVYQQDRDLRYTWMYNPPAFTTEDIVGKTDADFVLPEEADHLTAMKQHVLTSGEGVHEEIRVTGDNGVRTELLTVEPLRNSHGAIIGVTGTSIDITERKKLEEERKRLEQEAGARAKELEAIFEAMTDSVTVLDAQGHVVQMNQSARQLLARYLPSSEPERNVTMGLQYAHPHDPEGHLITEATSPIFRLLRGETLVGTRSQDVVIRTHDGNHLLLNVAGAPLRDDQERQIGVVSVVRDLTEQRRLEQRTHKALDALLKMAQVMVQGLESDREIYSAPMPGVHYVTQRVAELTRDVLGCERLSLMQVESGTERLRPLAVVGLSPDQEHSWWAEQEHSTVYLSDGPDQTFVERLHQQESFVLDLTQPPWNEQANPYAVRTMLVAPLSFRAQLVGLLQLDYGGQDHVYTDEEISLTQAAGRFVALIIEREQLLTERDEAHVKEALFRAENQRLADLIALAHDAVIVRDPTSRILFWNQGASRLYGWTEQEAIGNLTHILLSTRFPISSEAVDTILAQAGQWEGILIHAHRGGQDVIVESRQALVRDATGEPSAILEINRDITERERFAQERAEAQASELALRETNRMMDEFIGIAGHELRTPLTTVKASVQLAKRQLGRVLKQNSLQPSLVSQLSTVQAHLGRAERQIAMQNRLVSDLLDVSRIHSGRLELHPDLCDLVSLVQQVVEDQQYLTPERTLDLTITTQGELLVMADADRLRQVVSNYLSNALKYSHATKPVNIRVEVIDIQVRVSVSDQGPGLSFEQQQRVWERFYRAPGIEVRTGSGVGLGLGLHISRMIIERQRGQVGVHSEQGHGSTFWFTLPLAEHEVSD